MQYDMQIICPVIPDRLESFKKHGFYNLKQKKVLLHCLIGTHDKKQYEDGWPKNLEVDIVSSLNNNPVLQIFNFLSKLKPEDVVGDWFGKIDDDSFNDADKLIEHFNKIYDYNKEFYLVPQIRIEMQNSEIEILKKLNLWNEVDFKFTHELEACWFSRAAMQNILKNQKCLNLFEERSKVPFGFTDQCMGAAAKLCKIYPIEDYLCTVMPHEFFRCSLFEGDAFHFHPVCAAKDPLIFNLFLTILENNTPSKELQSLENKKYFLITKSKHEEIDTKILNLLPSNKIRQRNDFKFYFQNGKDLILVRICGYAQYFIFKDFNLKEGRCAVEPEFTYELLEYK